MTERDFTTMPPAEEMVRRLKEEGLYGVAPQIDKLYDHFIETVADSEKYGEGLNLAWELAMYDTLGNYPQAIRVTAELGYDRVIDIVTPDPAVAEKAKQMRRQVLEELQRGQ